MLYTYIIITTLISWCVRNVLPLFYLAPTNTIVLTLYISSFCTTYKKPQTDHKGKTLGVSKIRAPPRKQRDFERL